MSQPNSRILGGCLSLIVWLGGGEQQPSWSRHEERVGSQDAHLEEALDGSQLPALQCSPRFMVFCWVGDGWQGYDFILYNTLFRKMDIVNMCEGPVENGAARSTDLLSQS